MRKLLINLNLIPETIKFLKNITVYQFKNGNIKTKIKYEL